LVEKEEHMSKVGALIIGGRGATASTLIATALAPREGDEAKFLISEQPFAKSLELVGLSDLVWGGWDLTGESWAETLMRHGVLPPKPETIARLAAVREWAGVVLEQDHAAVTDEAQATKADGTAIVERLRSQIRGFVRETGVEQVVMLNLGAPAKLPPSEVWPADERAFMGAIAAGLFRTAAPYYFAAAALEGVAIADYTASATLEIPGLLALAEGHGAPLAGRDGSTGQTLLKSVLADTFATRRLRVRGWYSTNILGNHDGLVLQDERYVDVKRYDKTALLEQILGYQIQSHLVDIRYYLPAGDEKEAWDAIDFEAWHGGRGQLRINWRCSDSLLATPPLLDLIRFLAHAKRRGHAGLQAALGVFFKHPLGTDERRYLHLARALEEYCRA
jgi:myo-inositol-1-phosphate synthase